MALFEYYCHACRETFEQLTSASDPEMGKCPKCKGKNTKKQISKFAVGGQGDLRESTMHGCHDHSLHPSDSHGHDDGDH